MCVCVHVCACASECAIAGLHLHACMQVYYLLLLLLCCFVHFARKMLILHFSLHSTGFTYTDLALNLINMRSPFEDKAIIHADFPVVVQTELTSITQARYIPDNPIIAPGAAPTPQEGIQTLLCNLCRLLLVGVPKVLHAHAANIDAFTDEQLEQLLNLNRLVPAVPPVSGSNFMKAVQTGSEFVFDAVLIGPLLDATLAAAPPTSFHYNRYILTTTFWV